MWKSPIEKIYGDIQSQIIKQDEERMMYTVNQAIGYTVDKEELLRALQYDRDQYTKGYSDCKADMLTNIKEARYEIEHLSKYGKETYYKALDDVLEILDKLIKQEERK